MAFDLLFLCTHNQRVRIGTRQQILMPPALRGFTIAGDARPIIGNVIGRGAGMGSRRQAFDKLVRKIQITEPFSAPVS